jgi:hypothetical protein
MGFFSKHKEQSEASSLSHKAIDLEVDGKFAEAAAAYAREATLDYEANGNELIFAGDCINAFKNYLRVGDINDALGQARRALQGYEMGDWLSEGNDEEYLNELTGMVSQMRSARYRSEAEAFLADVNAALAKLGRPAITVTMITIGGGEYRFPDDCPHCGAALHAPDLDPEYTCPFCRGTVHAIDE